MRIVLDRVAMSVGHLPRQMQQPVPVYSFETLLCAYAAIGIEPICSART